jgi:hypothetical protein
MSKSGNRTETDSSAKSSGRGSVKQSRRAVVLSALATGAVAGCLSGGSGQNAAETPTPYPTFSATPTDTPTPTATPEPEPLEGPFPESQKEIAQYREQRLADHYEKHDDPSPEDATRISSLQELNEYAKEDRVHVKMEPGTYEITPDNFANIIEPAGRAGSTFLDFSGEHSYWDLRDVTIETETRVLGQITEALPSGHTSIEEVRLSARDSILRGLEYENIHNDDWSVEEYTAESARVFNIQGAQNLIHDVSITSRGSWPYGYSSMLGKGGPSLAPIRKKGCIAGGGYKNLHVGMEGHCRTFGHALGFLDIRNLEFIDCVIEGEIRNTNEIYEEESGRAHEILKENDFKPVGGDSKIPRGVMISLVEGGMRTYGDTAVAKILNTTYEATRGIGLACTSGRTEVYIAGSRFRNNSRRNLNAAPNTTIRNCEAGFRYGPGLLLGAWCNHIRNVDAEVTLLPSETPASVRKQVYSVKGGDAPNPWPFVAAGISGTGHDVVLKQEAEDLGKPDAPIVVGFQKFAQEPARDITLTNRTDQPVILRESAENCTVKSRTPVEDRGSNNDVQPI